MKNLLDVVTDDRIHDVYFDNFFTSVPLLEELKNKGIPATGTIRINRLPGLPPPSNKETEKKETGFMSVCSTEDLCSVRWVDNKLVTVVSNQLMEGPTSRCKRYSKVQKCKIDVPQPHLIQKYNAYIGGVDQLDGYLNNLRPCIGVKKWYWMQLINLVRLLQVVPFCIFCHFHPEKKVSQLEFVRAIVYQYVRFDRKTERLNVRIPNLVSKSTNGHYLAKQRQGRCKFCQKNCSLICNACNVRLQLECFPLYHTD